MSTIVIVEPTQVTLPHIVGAIERLGHDACLIYQRDHYTPESMEHVCRVKNLECDTASLPAIIATLERQTFDWVGVTTTADRIIRTAYALSAHFGVPGPDRSIADADKASTFLAAPALFPSTEIFDPRDPPLACLEAKLRSEGAFVCKPSHAAGGDGIFLVDDSSQLSSLATRFDQRFLDQRWLAQHSVDGTLLSIEGYVLADNCTALASARVHATASSAAQTVPHRSESRPHRRHRPFASGRNGF